MKKPEDYYRKTKHGHFIDALIIDSPVDGPAVRVKIDRPYSFKNERRSELLLRASDIRDLVLQMPGDELFKSVHIGLDSVSLTADELIEVADAMDNPALRFTESALASVLGSKGGKATSAAKREAVRINGTKGGRPRKKK